MYTISQFRQNIRKAFNDANEGHEVVIERYGQKFQLVALVSTLLPGHKIESSPESYRLANTEPYGISLVNKEEGSKKGLVGEVTGIGGRVIEKRADGTLMGSRFGKSLCKIHALPLDSRGRCLQKGCKYA
jgi:hypothetical protein